jgi:hypothetical protein
VLGRLKMEEEKEEKEKKNIAKNQFSGCRHFGLT